MALFVAAVGCRSGRPDCATLAKTERAAEQTLVNAVDLLVAARDKTPADVEQAWRTYASRCDEAASSLQALTLGDPTAQSLRDEEVRLYKHNAESARAAAEAYLDMDQGAITTHETEATNLRHDVVEASAVLDDKCRRAGK